ncbi:MAG: IPT/TIG domain-containing protein, partial [Actinomycetota bacterium]|nr:IPT/TIG domain-containing protein [Actinomycetota bacterium]
TVTVAGSGFQPGETSVTIDGVTIPAADITVTSPNSLTFTTPAHPAGQVPVTVTTPAGTSGTLPFTYVGDAMNSGPENNGRGGTGTVLAATGSPTGPLLELAVLLLTAGCAFLLFSRRPVIGRHRR